MRFLSLLSILAVFVVAAWSERATAQTADAVVNPAANAPEQIKSSIKLLGDLKVDDFIRIVDAFLTSKPDHAAVVQLKRLVMESKLTDGMKYDTAARQLNWTLTAKQPFKSPDEKTAGEELMRQILGFAHEANQLLVQSAKPGSNEPSDYDVVMGKAQFAIVVPAEPEVLKPIRDYLTSANMPVSVNDLTMRVVESGSQLGEAMAYDEAKRQLSWTLNAKQDYSTVDELDKTKGIMRNIVMASYGAAPGADLAIVENGNYLVLFKPAIMPTHEVVFRYYPARRSRLFSFLARIFDRCYRPTWVCCKPTAIATVKPCNAKNDPNQTVAPLNEKTAADEALSTILVLTGFKSAEVETSPLPLTTKPPVIASDVGLPAVDPMVIAPRRQLTAADIPELKGADVIKRAGLSEQWLGTGYHSYWQGREDEATQYFEKCVAANPNEAAAWAFLTLIELRKGNRELAEEYVVELQRVLARKNNDRSVVNRMLERVQGSLRRDFEALLRSAVISSQFPKNQAEVIVLR